MSNDCIAADWPAPPGIVAGTTLRDSHFVLPGKPRRLRQVHGARVVRYESAGDPNALPEADAIIADSRGATCVVRTADCLPVLLCATDGSEIAAVHGGWRGLAAGIIENTVTAMSASPRELLAWFGPAISQPAFEVGGEVRDAFLADHAAATEAFVPNERGRWQADIYALATQRLASVGVINVFGGGLCTFGDAKRFYSYRRDGDTGRLESFIFRAEQPINLLKMQ